MRRSTYGTTDGRLVSADPQTPAPLDIIPYPNTSGPSKRDRDEEVAETEWTLEELEVVQSVSLSTNWTDDRRFGIHFAHYHPPILQENYLHQTI